jgi:hypothetical protein
MNAISHHVRTPDELAHQGVCGIDNSTVGNWQSAWVFPVDSLIATTLRDGADQDRPLPRLVV